MLKKFIKNEKPVIFSINFIPEFVNNCFAFISNQKRLQNFSNKDKLKIIATSNLISEDFKFDYIINYSSYLGIGSSSDNAGAMLIRFLSKLNVGMLYLAGFDGFDSGNSDNYCVPHGSAIIELEIANQKNHAISTQLKNALNKIPYKLLTPTRYDI